MCFRIYLYLENINNDKIQNVEGYIENIPEDRAAPFMKLKETIGSYLSAGFEECLSYNMIGYVVRHSTYPDGYHCDPKLPLPFINIAN